MIRTLAFANYRSLRDIVVTIGRLTVVTGPNGSGKSSLYRGLRLLAAAADGTLVAQLAGEGGLPSTLWAGPEQITAAMRSGRHPVQGAVRKERVALKLGFASDDFGYCVDLGLPPPIPPTAFASDPAFKTETIWAGPAFRPAARLVERRGPLLRAIDDRGAWRNVLDTLSEFESMMTEFVAPDLTPEMATLRSRLRGWRFYDHLRTDRDAPARSPQIGTYTPVLGHDGADLAAALQTIREIGDADQLSASIEDAFPGSTVEIETAAARFAVALRQPGMLRPLAAAEVSDGTLRYLLLAAALLTPRPPEFMVLNEPETSLHPDLLPALARLICAAAERSQIMVVTHSATLVRALSDGDDVRLLELGKSFGETTIMSSDDRPAWTWPSR